MDRTCAVDRRHGMYGGIYLINEKHKKIGRRGGGGGRPAPRGGGGVFFFFFFF